MLRQLCDQQSRLSNGEVLRQQVARTRRAKLSKGSTACDVSLSKLCKPLVWSVRLRRLVRSHEHGRLMDQPTIFTVPRCWACPDLLTCH